MTYPPIFGLAYSGSKRTVIDGPFVETKKITVGYVIQVKTRGEAVERTKRFPNPVIDGKEGEIEVRQLFELDDFRPWRASEKVCSTCRLCGPRSTNQ